MVEERFDYIVVGAGSAGAALANRLSADPARRILLLEAGRSSHPWSPIPVGFARLIDNPAANWLYTSEPEDSTGGRRIPVPRGRLLGGSSAINGMVFVRGQAEDFDGWAQLGNRGWSYRDVLPVFRKIESYAGGEDEFRGRDGPIRVTDPDESGPLYYAIVQAGREVGLSYNADYNGASQDGIAMTQASISGGWRMSTARCYLDPARSRLNLDIRANAPTEALLFDGRRCIGVRYRRGGQVCEAKANAEVVLSAGAVASPQLLELSGIGQAERLKALGIPVIHALPGVGENLRDHYAPRMKWRVPARGLTYNDKARGLGLVWQALKFAFARTGLLSLPASPLRAYIRTRPGLASPDAVICWIPFLSTGYRLDRESGLTVITHPLRSESLGSIHVTSADPAAAPEIRFNFLSAAIDREVTLGGMRFARRLMAAPALAGIVGEELAPGAKQEGDDDLIAWVKENAETTYHPVGTCKMGSDTMAVVDDRLRVHGIEGLRVADASIMPTLTSGNTNAPSIMIGEKAAEMIMERV